MVYDILKKQASGDLSDRPRTPKHQPNKTPAVIEDKVIEAKNKTHLGPIRLPLYLAKYEQVEVAPGTIRHIIQKYRHRITYNVPTTKRRKMKREFVDWYCIVPLEIIQVDLKHMRDQKALSKEQIMHLDKYSIPNYQWLVLVFMGYFMVAISWREVRDCFHC